MTIRTKPASQAYRDNYDTIFGIDEELTRNSPRPNESSELAEAYAQADSEFITDGLIGLDTASRIIELGGDVSIYE